MANEAQERAVAKDLMLTGEASVKKFSIMPAKLKRSADPRNKYCTDTQRNVIRRGSVESRRLDWADTRFSSGYRPGKWVDNMIVHWCKEHDGEDRKYGERSWWNP